MQMCPPHAVGHQWMVESVDNIFEQAPALLGNFVFWQRAHSGEQVAIGPLIVTGHRFQNFAIGHGNTFYTPGEMPAVECTECCKLAPSGERHRRRDDWVLMPIISVNRVFKVIRNRLCIMHSR